MIKRNFTASKNSYSKDKDKSDVNTILYENNESYSINSFKKTKKIQEKLSLQTPKKNKRKAGSTKKKESVNSFSGNNNFKILLNECLLNINQQVNRKNIVNDNISKADKKFLKEYKLNYLNSRRGYSRSSSPNDKKSNISSDDKNNKEIRKSSFHKSNSLKKNNTKPINLININSKFFPKNDQNLLKIKVTNYDKINNIKFITNISSSNTNSNIKLSGLYSEDSSLNNKSNKPIINLPKKKENKKFSNKKIQEYKTNSNIHHSKKNLHKLDIEQSCFLLDECKNLFKHNNTLINDKNKLKTIVPKPNQKLKFPTINPQPKRKKIDKKKLFAIPEYIKHSSIISKEDIVNLPFLYNNLSNEELKASSNIKQIIEKNISDFKSSLVCSSFKIEGTKKLEMKNGFYNSKECRNKCMITNKNELNDVEIEKSEIKSTTFTKNNKIINKNNRIIKEDTNINKNNKNQNNFLLETSNTLQLLNDNKSLINNISINDNSNSQIVLLNQNNQRINNTLSENNQFIKGKTNNDVFLKKVNSKLSTKYLIKLEIFRNLERKNIVYDSFDEEESDEFDENTLCISPNSFIVIFFDIYIAISSIFYMVAIPLHFARNKEFCNNTIFGFNKFLIYLTEIIFFVDVIIGFFKMYYNFEEQLINDHPKIVSHYLKGNFVLDLISAIPLLSIKILKAPKCSILNNITLSHHKYYDCQLNNLSDLWELIKIIKVIKIMNDNVFIKFVYKCINELEASEKIITYITYISIVSISLHFATCLNIFISRNSYPNWITSLNKQNEPFSKIYVVSLYHIITTVTTVGYGDILPCSFKEHIFQLIILLIGIVAYSWMITSISNYINTNNEKYIEYEKKVQILEDIKLKNPKIPKTLYNKILRHLTYGKKRRKNNYSVVFEILPYSLKNLLIYEIYKPIINNFIIFKNTHNSDFVISTIMAFKPFSAVKNDLIVKYGDILEEMIFVKKGKLSIEVSINKKYQTKLIESYLSDQFFHDDKIFLSTQRKIGNVTNAFNCNLLNHNNKNKISSLELDECSLKKDKKKLDETIDNQDEINLRILDIRENEHFGDILMFLGYKSPINMRVKSKTVELFLLSKVDAINISLTYKNIWNRINEKSTYNIEQIKLQIQKIVKQYCKFLGIKIDENNKVIISSINRKNTKLKTNKKGSSKSHQITKIIESNVNNYNSTNLYQNYNSTISNRELIKPFEKNNYSVFKKSKDKKDKKNKNIKKCSFDNNKKEKIEKQKINSSSIDSEPVPIKKKEEFRNTDLFKLSNEFSESSDIKSNESKNYIKLIPEYKLGKNNSSDSKNEKYLSNEYQFSNHNRDENENVLTLFKQDEINDEIYPGEIFENEINKNFNDEMSFSSYDKKYNNYSFHIKNYLEENILQKKKTKENNSKIKKNIITLTKYSNKIINKYSNNVLTEIKNLSLEYKSMYENLNQLTNYQYSKDNELQSKTKIFLENTCFNNNSINKKDISDGQIDIKKIKMNNFINANENITEVSNDGSPHINKKLINTKINANSKKFITNNICTVNTNENNSLDVPQKINNFCNNINKRRSSVSYLPSSSKKLNKENNSDIIQTLKRKKTIRKSGGKISSYENSNNNLSPISHKKTQKVNKSNKSNKLLNIVNKNIIQNSQNINNPKMFYCDLFTNLIKNQKLSKIAENQGKEDKNDKNDKNDNTTSDKDYQNYKLSFINNKKKTFSNFDFIPILGEEIQKTKRKWKSKKYLKETIKNNLDNSYEFK